MQSVPYQLICLISLIIQKYRPLSYQATTLLFVFIFPILFYHANKYSFLGFAGLLFHSLVNGALYYWMAKSFVIILRSDLIYWLQRPDNNRHRIARHHAWNLIGRYIFIPL